eukprot:s1898_g6.t1
MATPTAATIDKETEAILVASAKAKTVKKRANSLDPTRRMKADPRDPRTSVRNWPCYGQHLPGSPGANMHGQWIHCQVCDLRLAKKRVTFEHYGGSQPTDGPAHADRARGALGHDKANSQGVPPHVRQDHCRRGTEQGGARASGTAEWEYLDEYTEAGDPARLRHECDGQRRGGADHRLRDSGHWGPVNVAAKDYKTKPLGQHVAKKVMLMATLMSSAMTSTLLGLRLDGRDGLWEISGAPHSWLSEATAQQGISSKSINYQTGYDLYKEETWKRLRDLLRVHQPRKLWFSLPCSTWSPWKRVSQGNAVSSENEATTRRRQRRLLLYAVDFIKYVLAVDSEVDIYWEWPTDNLGWKQPGILQLEQWLRDGCFDWLGCRVDACNYGLRHPDDHDFIYKRWSIFTTDGRFHKQFRAKVCPGNHRHCRRADVDHTKESYYPWRMVEAVARHWKDSMTPSRHRQLLSLREDLPALQDEDHQPHELQAVLEEPEGELQELPDGLDDSLAINIVTETERLQQEHQAREARMRGQFDFTTCERLLSQLHSVARSSGHTHQRGTRSGVNSFLLGAYSHGAFCGVTRLSQRLCELVKYVNFMLRHHLPQHNWSSIMVTFNTRALPHRDHHNPQSQGDTQHFCCALETFNMADCGYKDNHLMDYNR